MRSFPKIHSTLNSLLRRKRAENELASELQDHLLREIAQNQERGMSPDEAAAAAHRLIGSLAVYQEECRDQWGIAVIENLQRDLRFAIRMLKRTPVFTAVALVTLALGIGANSTIFTFVENFVLRPLPIHEPHEVVSLNWGDAVNISYPNYADFRDRNSTFAELAACRLNTANLSLQARNSLRGWGYEVTGNYFHMLGVSPLLGRLFGPAEDDVPGRHPVIVLSARFWRRAFAGDPQVIGRTIKINGYVFTVIGVAPPEFTGTELIAAADFWVPSTMELQVEPGNDWIHARGAGNLWLIGRLKPGVSRARAAANLDEIAQQLSRAYPDQIDPKAKFELASPGLVGKYLRAPVTRFGIVFLAVAGAGLLLACINLAGMLLARASDRRREFGIRLAIGASRRQLVRQLMIENLVLALCGGLAGLGVAFGICAIFNSWRPGFDFPLNISLHPDGTVLAFTLAAALFTTILFGFVPALQTARASLIPSLKNEPAVASFRRWTLRDALVVGQIALSMALVISSVLVVRSLQHALSLNLGFEPANAVSVSFDLNIPGFNDERVRQFHEGLFQRLSTLPGLEAVGITNNLPLRMGEDNNTISRTDRPIPKPADRRAAILYTISPGYLRAAGTHLLRGRDIDARDRQHTNAVGLINEALSTLLFHGENPIGRRIRRGENTADPGFEIVGIVENGKYEFLGEDPHPVIFLPLEQSETRFTTVVARSAMPAAQVTAMLRKAALDLQPDLTLFNEGGLRDQLALPLFPARITAIVLGVFGGLAVLLAATGLFAMMGYTVSRRTREIGIRMALGAHRSQVLRSVLSRTMALCIAGIVAGSALALASSRLLQAVLYGISPRDPATYATGLLLMVLVTLLACWHPAARAMHVDPARTLREE